jgi:hypothetical protein
MPNCLMVRGSQSCLLDVATFTPRPLFFVESAKLPFDHKAALFVTHFVPLAMNKIPNRFRPSSAMDTRSIMRERRKYGALHGNYNWQSRIKWYPAGFKLNRKTIFRQFGNLHYLACHSPERVQRQWQKVYNNFHTKHFGTFKGSMRYLNQWSCHAWL